MKTQSKTNEKYLTKDKNNQQNGFLIPIYNINEDFFPKGSEPQQVYLTVIEPGKIKGPHLHYIRNGCFTCIKGNARFVLKSEGQYKIFYSGEEHNFCSVIVPKGVAAALQNIGEEDAYVINMPSPAWTPTMNDEYTSDFSDFDFKKL